MTIEIFGYVKYKLDLSGIEIMVPFRMFKNFIVERGAIGTISFRAVKGCCKAFRITNQIGKRTMHLYIEIITRINTKHAFECKSCMCIQGKQATAYANIVQYNAIADGKKQIYTNQDELNEYGDCGILDPSEVSYYQVYVNGQLYPKECYDIRAGRIYFNEHYIPSKERKISIVFFQLYDSKGILLSGTVNYYSTRADGVSRSFKVGSLDAKDGMSQIPNEDEVSAHNLYINGVLQPKITYKIMNHELKIVTDDLPKKVS